MEGADSLETCEALGSPWLPLGARGPPAFLGICSNLTRLYLAMLLPLSISDRAWNRYRRQGGLPLDRGMTINGTTEVASFQTHHRQCRVPSGIVRASSLPMRVFPQYLAPT